MIDMKENRFVKNTAVIFILTFALRLSLGLSKWYLFDVRKSVAAEKYRFYARQRDLNIPDELDVYKSYTFSPMEVTRRGRSYTLAVYRPGGVQIDDESARPDRRGAI